MAELDPLDEWMSRTEECILIIMRGAGFTLQAEINATFQVLEIRYVLQELPEAEADGTKGQACAEQHSPLHYGQR